MLRTLSEWKVFAFEKGTSGDMVLDILKDWQEDRDCLLANQSSSFVLEDEDYHLEYVDSETIRLSRRR